jgi:anti-sigma factor RsiW
MKTKNALTTQDMERLSALFDGELSPTNAEALRQRMHTDAALQDAYTELALTQDAMRTMPTLKPPRSLRIDPQRLQQARGWRWWLISPPGGRLFPTLGAA